MQLRIGVVLNVLHHRVGVSPTTLNNGVMQITFGRPQWLADLTKRQRCVGSAKREIPSGPASCFLNQLHARREPEFGIDVSEMGLNSARGDEQSAADVFVAKALTDEADHIVFGGG